MKIFITNKSEFEKCFSEHKDLSRYLTTKQIHQKLFNQIKLDIELNNLIQLSLLVTYKTENYLDGKCIFNFVGKTKDIYFYEFNGTIF